MKHACMQYMFAPEGVNVHAGPPQGIVREGLEGATRLTYSLILTEQPLSVESGASRRETILHAIWLCLLTSLSGVAGWPLSLGDL